MSTTKRSSYPSRQLRGGPAPLASFEDLSDEIESPEEQVTEAHLGDGLLSPDNETEEDTKTYSDGATPSTPRVLAQTPSTPLALDGFSAVGTPDSFGHLEVFPGSSSRPGTPLPPLRKDSTPNSTSRGSLSSPLFGRRSKAGTPDGASDFLTSNSSIESKDTVSSVRLKPKSGPGTPSPRSARKIFTMSFFKPRDDKTPSPLPSPKSPRKTSPAVSPKSPRRSSPFSGLFKGSGGKEETEPSASPTKRKSHFSNFLRPKEEKRQDPAPPGEQHGRKTTRVFANLFGRGHHKDGSGKTAVSPSVEQAPATQQTPEDEEWIPAPNVYATRTIHSPRDAPIPLPPTIAEDMSWFPMEPPELPAGSEQTFVTGTQRIVQGTPDIAGADGLSLYDPTLRLGLSPSTDAPTRAARLEDLAIVTAAAAVDAKPPGLEEQPPPPATGGDSPESEVEVPEADPTILKTVLKGKEPEAETLLREDSFDGEEFPVPELVDSSKVLTDKEVSRHRDKMAAFRVNPVDRPRSTAPVSFASLEAYINKAARPDPVAESNADKVKLKVVLPGEEFEHRERQPKKAVYKSWFEFCEVGLQSPRSRRRQLGGRGAPSSVPASREVTMEEEDRRAESVDFGMIGKSEAWASFESPPGSPRRQRSESSSRSSSPKNSDGDSNPAFLKDEEVEPLVQSDELLVKRDSKGSPSELSPVDYATTDGRDSSTICSVLPPSLLPDCVYSVIRSEELGRNEMAEPPACWSNGVMDLLASLPSPKQEPVRVPFGNGHPPHQEIRDGMEPPVPSLINDQGEGV